MDEFLKGVGICVGVFIGVVAGTLVTLLIQWANEKRLECQLLQRLKFELRLNIRKIDQWLAEMVSYRNAVNANGMQTYFGYFDLSRYVSVMANTMFVSGLIYKYLSDDEIGKLQVITGEFSPGWEAMLNSQVAQNKATFLQTKAAQDVNFWERKFKEHKATLEGMLKKIE